MNKKYLSILLVIALVVTAVAIYVSIKQAPDSKLKTEGLFLPDLKTNMAKIGKITINKADNDTLTFLKTDNNWVLAEKNNYPVNMKAMNEMVFSLVEAHLFEAKTQKASNYPHLGVEEISTPHSRSAQVVLESSTGEVLHDVIIGKYKIQKGTYIRKSSEKQAWLTRKKILIPGSFLEWINRTIISINQEQIKETIYFPSATKINNGSIQYALNRDDIESEIKLVYKSDPAETPLTLKSQHVANNQMKLLGELTLDDIEARDNSIFLTADILKPTVSKRIYRTFNGIEIILLCLPIENNKAKIVIDINHYKNSDDSSSLPATIYKIQQRINNKTFIIANHLYGKFNKQLSDLSIKNNND